MVKKESVVGAIKSLFTRSPEDFEKQQQKREDNYYRKQEKNGNYAEAANYYQWEGITSNHPTKKRMLLEKAGETYLKDKKDSRGSAYFAAQCFIKAGDHKKAGEAYLKSAAGLPAISGTKPSLGQIGYVWKEHEMEEAAKEFEVAGEHKRAAGLLLELKEKYGQGSGSFDRSLYRNLKKSGQYEKLKELQNEGKLNLEPSLNKQHDSYLTKIDEGLKRKHTGLEKIAVTASITGILGGLFFLSTNITGNAIADLTTKTTSFLGAGLLIVGLVAGFFWLRNRKR